MKYKEEIDSIDKIPNLNYEGYYWGSGDTKPVPVKNENPRFDELTKDSLFIQEAMLWNEEKGISIMINHTGKQQINAYELTKDDLSEKEDLRVYESIRLKNKKMKFLQYWEEGKDEHCSDFPVLKMKAQVFVGFDK